MVRRGFFTEEKLLSEKPKAEYSPKCGACGLHKHCESPKMPVTGRGLTKTLVIGEAPGRQEDKDNEQFVGKAGKKLRETMQKMGVKLNRDCWKTNSLICWPGEGNPTPTPDQLSYCAPNLVRTMKELQPERVLLFGATALTAFLRGMGVWESSIDVFSRWIGWTIPCQTTNSWICPIYHPSYVLREKRNPTVDLWFRKHIEAAFNLPQRRPWKTTKDYAKRIKIVMDPERAARIIDSFIEAGHPVAFDLETNMLKPDSPEAEIVCCSVCSAGNRTISFPWVGAAIDAMKRLCRSRVKKIAANMKFEDRWMRSIGAPVRGWLWDTMQNAHLLDNRRLITGLKFQSFVNFGVNTYNQHIDPYLEPKRAKGGYAKNRIHEIPLEDLLIYCGVDSLLEWMLAKLQRKQLGWSL